MSTDESPSGTTEQIRGWFTGRLPQEWTGGAPAAPTVTVDREEITVVVTLADVEVAEGASDAERSAARAGRARAWREDTREQRMAIARDAEHSFDRKVAWGVDVAGHRELFTHVAVPVMTRLRQPERLVLDTLVQAGVARSRADALAWCVRLTGRNTDEWLGRLREAVADVEKVRAAGPQD